jgi:hypothetical protein
MPSSTEFNNNTFEYGTTTFWSCGSPYTKVVFDTTSSDPHAGSWCANFGCNATSSYVWNNVQSDMFTSTAAHVGWWYKCVESSGAHTTNSGIGLKYMIDPDTDFYSKLLWSFPSTISTDWSTSWSYVQFTIGDITFPATSYHFSSQTGLILMIQQTT